MKKIISLLFVLAIAFSVVMSVSAAGISADEQKIIDSLKAAIQTQNGSFTLPASYVTQAENYLAKKDITADDVSKILAEINASKDLMKTTDAKNMAEIPQTIRSQIVANAVDAGDVVNAIVTINNANDVKVVDKDTNEVVFDGVASAIKYTGSFLVVSIVLAVVLLLGTASVIFLSRKIAVK